MTEPNINRIRTQTTIGSDARGRLVLDFTGYLLGQQGIITRMVAGIVGTALQNPTWDAFIGDLSDPSNLVDSSQGTRLPKWVPALVNGQPISQGDILTIVAYGNPGTQLVASCYLASQVVPAGT